MTRLRSPLKKERTSKIRSEGGQGMLEYIMVIVVTVTIILGLMQKMYTPLGEFVESLMGTYVRCLLETGELPSQGGLSDEDRQCQYSLPWVESTGGNTDPQRQNQQSKSRSGDDSSGDDKDEASSGGGGSSSMSQSRRAGAPRRAIVGSSGSLGRGSMGSETGAGGEGGRQTVVAAENESRGRGFFGSGSGGNRIVRQRSRYVALSGEMEAALAKKKKRDEKSTKSVQKVEGGGGFARTKKVSFKPPERRPTNDDDLESRGIDIALIVKYLLIAGIIILLIVLIGGQALQMTKNWEKSE